MDGAFSTLHPTVAGWCDEHLHTATPPQARALPLAGSAVHTLICSPTGTGKTLAAFLPVMSRLAELRDADALLAGTYCLYISPLRALGYDVEHNLRRPLREMGLLERPNTERARGAARPGPRDPRPDRGAVRRHAGRGAAADDEPPAPRAAHHARVAGTDGGDGLVPGAS